MFVVGLTGGIGSGKSTVGKVFNWLGIPIYDSDVHAKRLMRENGQIVEEIKNLLGNDSYLSNGSLNSSWIGTQVFNNKILLTQLNQIVHPRVYEDFDQWKTLQNSIYIIKESALLHMTLTKQPVDKIIVVTAPQKIRIQRVIQRDSADEAKVLSRIKNQISEKELLKIADFRIKNDGNSALLPQVLKVHYKICNFANSNL